MHFMQFFPDIKRQSQSKKEKVIKSKASVENVSSIPIQIPGQGQKTLLRPTSNKKMPNFIKNPSFNMKRHSSTPNMKVGSNKKLSSVSEEEEMAFNYQMALLEEPPEWDLDDAAGIGSKTYESPSLTPPAITTSRASSPSRMEKVAETSKKRIQKFQKLASKIRHDQTFSDDSDDDERLSKSLPDLSKLSGKGHAGNLTNSKGESRGRRRSIDDNGLKRTRSKSGPPSWRLPPQSYTKRMPHVREAVPPPSFPIGPVNLKHHQSSVMARAMWKNGEVRYEDQWGRRLVPIRQNSFMFDLWPVSEITEEETPGVEKIQYIEILKK